MTTNASDLLRQEFGITEDRAARDRGTPVCTVRELRALRAALRLSIAQFATRFGLSRFTLGAIVRRGADQPVYLRPDATAALQPILARARELGALAQDPGTQPHRPHVSRADVAHYRCSGCGADLPHAQVWHRGDDASGVEIMHGTDAAPCGPVQVAPLRAVRPAPTSGGRHA